MFSKRQGHYLLQILGIQRLQHIHRHARQQSRVELKGRILGGRTNEGEQTALDMRQKCVLLALVETVHFVYEHDGVPAIQSCTCRQRALYRLPNVLDTSQNGTNGDELGLKSVSHQAGNGGLAHAWGTPENATVGLTGLERQS